MPRWRRPGVRVTIRPAAEAYEARQPVKVRVTAEARRDTTVRSASAYLVASLWYGKDRVVFYGPYAGGYTTRQSPASVTVGQIGLGIPAIIRAGERAECEAVLPNLATAPSWGDKPAQRIAYSVQARVHLADGSVCRGTAPVRLLSPRSLYQQVEGTAMRPTYVQAGKCDLELDLPALHAQPGETLRGTLHIRPRESLRARRVTVSLVSIETVTGEKPARTVSYDDYRRDDVKYPYDRNVHRTSVLRRRRITLTGPCEIPFVAQLPGGVVPTAFTGYLSRRWYVQATVTYALFSQDDCGLELNVHTGQ